jgi:zinc-binding alcohol dehydrogenase/oxidoreductase
MLACVGSASRAGSMELKQVPVPVPRASQALVRLEAAALNRRDQYILEGTYPDIRLPCVLGSDGCGIVVDTGDDLDRDWIGKRVILQTASKFTPTAHSREYTVLGMPHDGVFAEYVVVDIDRLFLVPPHLSPIEAAAIPLAGLTAYRAVATKGEVRSGSTVLVTGIGGGVAQFAAQFSQALGAIVYASSGSDWKLEKARHQGLAGVVNYTEDKWDRRLRKEAGGFDVVIDGAGGPQLDALLRMLRPGGILVSYGKTLGDPTHLSLFNVFWNSLSVRGTTLGTDEEFAAMLDLIEEKRLVPVVDSVRPFRQIHDALSRMKNGEQFGKLVVEFDGASRA